MHKKNNLKKTLFTIFVTTVYLLMIVVLILQALTPGKESSNISGSVGDVLDNVITDIQKPEAEIIDVDGVEILSLTVSGKTLDTEELTLYVGSSGKLNAKVTPKDATNPSLSYKSSDESVVQTYTDGRVKALKVGTAIITATSEENPDLFDSVTITVAEIAVENIALKNLPKELRVGQSHALEIKYTPTNTTQKDVEWKSSNTNVLTVSKSGKLTAKAEGTATITATSKVNGTLTDRVTITVLPQIVEPEIPVEGLTLQINDEIGYVGSTGKITAKLSPTGAKDGLVWSSSDKTIATVSQSGSVTYLKAGDVTITAKCSSYNVENSITLIVKEVLSKTIELDIDGLDETEDGGYSLKIASSGKVEATLDEKATVQEIIFTSSDPEIAKIGQDGVIEAVKEGTATITVSTSYDGETTSESFELTVLGYTFSDRFENFALWVRKSLGHFGAFMALGIFATLTYLMIFPKSTKGKLLGFVVCLVAGFAVAGITEICQLPLFTFGRLASFDDVLLDFFGYCFSVLPTYAIILFTHFISLLFKRIKK